MNTKFEYLYRDGSNYKGWGEVVFAGSFTDDVRRRLVRALDSGELFIADQVRVPEVFFEDQPLYADDHCWHEQSDVSETVLKSSDIHGRTFEEFVREVESASAAGWRVFDRLERQVKFSR